MAKVALLIGVGSYDNPDTWKPLPSASKDVQAMQQVLLAPEMGAFSEVIPLLDPEPTQMRETIETVFSSRSKEDLVLLYFSGHGVRDASGELHFATRITRKTPKGDLVKATAVDASFVREIMGNCKSRRQVIILDCCFSGAFDPALQTKDDGTLNLQEQLGAEGRVVLASSSSTQYSFEQDGVDLSIYTRYLVEGIETGAADKGSDGMISAHELHAYASRKVRETAPGMHPKMITLKDEGFDIVIAKAKITDPHLKYRQEVDKYASRGDISYIGRAVLDTLRVRLGIAPEKAFAIEQQVLQPYRERLGNLHRYRETFVSAIDHEYPLTDETRSELRDFQDILGLRREDVVPIEQEVLTQRFPDIAFEEPLQSDSRQDEQAVTVAVEQTVGNSKSFASLPVESSTENLSSQTEKASNHAVTKRRLIGIGAGVAALFAALVGYYAWQHQVNQGLQAKLGQAEERKTQQDYQTCMSLSQQIPTKSSFYQKAHSLLTECKQEQEAVDWLAQGQQKADKGDFQAAFVAVKPIPEKSRVYPEVQKRLGEWSETLLQQAKKLYENSGKITEATAKANLIPSTSPIYEKIKTTIAAWNEEWKANDDRLIAANQALKQGDWPNARNAAQNISPTTPHWQRQRDRILNKAQAELDAIEAQRQAEEERRQREIAIQQREKQNDQNQVERADEEKQRCEWYKNEYIKGTGEIVGEIGLREGEIRRKCRELGVDIPNEY